MLGVGGDVLLHAHGHGRGQAADLERVLAVGLLRAAPQRVAKDVHAGRQQQRLLGGHHLVADGLADGVLEIEVEGRAAGHADREDGRVADRRGASRLEAGGQQMPLSVLGEVHSARGVPVVEAANRRVGAVERDIVATLGIAHLGLAGTTVARATHLPGLVGEAHGAHEALHGVLVGLARRVTIRVLEAEGGVAGAAALWRDGDEGAGAVSAVVRRRLRRDWRPGCRWAGSRRGTCAARAGRACRLASRQRRQRQRQARISEGLSSWRLLYQRQSLSKDQNFIPAPRAMRTYRVPDSREVSPLGHF